MVCIGTVGGSPRKLVDRKRFNEGFEAMVEKLHPHTIVVVGSCDYECFRMISEQGIRVLRFDGCTARYFKAVKSCV